MLSGRPCADHGSSSPRQAWSRALVDQRRSRSASSPRGSLGGGASSPEPPRASPVAGRGFGEDRPHSQGGRRQATRTVGRSDRRRRRTATAGRPGDRPRRPRGYPWQQAGGRAVPTVEAPKLVTCRDCGGDFELSARRARDHRKAGTAPRCRPCREGHEAPKVTQEMRDWWLERFTVDEISELAARMWPES